MGGDLALETQVYGERIIAIASELRQLESTRLATELAFRSASTKAKAFGDELQLGCIKETFSDINKASLPNSGDEEQVHHLAANEPSVHLRWSSRHKKLEVGPATEGKFSLTLFSTFIVS